MKKLKTGPGNRTLDVVTFINPCSVERSFLLCSGNTYTNHWDAPTYMLNFEDGKLRGGRGVKQQIWDGMRPILEEWTGHELTESSLYGIRIYKDGAMLATRKSRLLPMFAFAMAILWHSVNCLEASPLYFECFPADGSSISSPCVVYAVFRCGSHAPSLVCNHSGGSRHWWGEPQLCWRIFFGSRYMNSLMEIVNMVACLCQWFLLWLLPVSRNSFSLVLLVHPQPWPVEVYSHDGQAHNVSMLPGDCVLYESHTVLHGRPFPLKGKFYVSINLPFSTTRTTPS